MSSEDLSDYLNNESSVNEPDNNVSSTDELVNEGSSSEYDDGTFVIDVNHSIDVKFDCKKYALIVYMLIVAYIAFNAVLLAYS